MASPRKLSKKKKKQIKKQREEMVAQLPILGFLVLFYISIFVAHKNSNK